MVRPFASHRLVRALPGARGFTLVEAMIVVAIVGVLGTLAAYGVRKYIYSAKSGEALEMMRTIKAAQETYRSETFAYLDVSGATTVTDMNTFQPTNDPGKVKYNWAGRVGDVADRWRVLNVETPQPVQFTYGSAAGASTVVPVPSGMTIANWPAAATGEVWYIVRAVGDLDGDNRNSNYVSASFTGEVFNDVEGE